MHLAAGADKPEAQSELALYIHWPFCASKCPYCDFNSHVRASIDHQQWRQALLIDLAHEAALTSDATIVSIFFGGGTPSLMPPEIAAALIDAASGYWAFAPDVEITLEANPSSVEASRFADLARAGVNRASLGLQSLDDKALRFLGRAHDAGEGRAALAAATATFERTSFDLIYALPGQSERAWEAELNEALKFGTGHLSLYQLTIEPGTRFAALAARGELEPVEPEHAAALYETTQMATQAAGLPAYEISNHARPGEESRHNLVYWRTKEHAGIGPGAHGRRGGRRTQRVRKPENWLAKIAASGHGIEEESAITAQEEAREALLMGLRLSEGVDLSAIEARTGAPVVDAAKARLLADHGLVALDQGRLRATPKGKLVLNAILAEIAI